MKNQIIQLFKDFNLSFDSQIELKFSDAYLFYFTKKENEIFEKEADLQNKLFDLIFNKLNVSYCEYKIFNSESDTLYLIIECDELCISIGEEK